MQKRSKVLAMGLSRYKLGELLMLCDERNSTGEYSLADVKGISIKKEFIETKADMAGVSLFPYILVRPDCFAYVTVTSRNGEKITLAHNTSKNTYIVSSSYIVFRVCRPDILLSDYLFIYFNRPEFDRYARFNSWGSARETFSWEDFRDIDITLPSIEQQRKYVNIYLSLQKNLEAYESYIEDLKIVCDGYIDRIKKNSPMVRLAELLEPVDDRNSDLQYSGVQGINISKTFFPTVADIDESSTNNYKIVKQNQFAFSGMQTGRDKCIRIALHDDTDPIIISPAYMVFQQKKTSVLNQYIMLWFSRKEVDRYGWFASDGSIRSNLDLERFYDMMIPIPDISIQQEIVDIHKCYIERQRIATQLREQLKMLCPILIKGAQTDN